MITAVKKSVLVTRGQKLEWNDGVFCHVESLFASTHSQGLEYKGETMEVEVWIDQGRLTLSAPELLPYVIQFLAHEQRNGEDGFLPLDGCHIGAGFRYLLGYSNEKQDSVGWYITR